MPYYYFYNTTESSSECEEYRTPFHYLDKDDLTSKEQIAAHYLTCRDYDKKETGGKDKFKYFVGYGTKEHEKNGTQVEYLHDYCTKSDNKPVTAVKKEYPTTTFGEPMNEQIDQKVCQEYAKLKKKPYYKLFKKGLKNIGNTNASGNNAKGNAVCIIGQKEIGDLVGLQKYKMNHIDEEVKTGLIRPPSGQSRSGSAGRSRATSANRSRPSSAVSNGRSRPTSAVSRPTSAVRPTHYAYLQRYFY